MVGTLVHLYDVPIRVSIGHESREKVMQSSFTSGKRCNFLPNFNSIFAAVPNLQKNILKHLKYV